MLGYELIILMISAVVLSCLLHIIDRVAPLAVIIFIFGEISVILF